MTGIASKFDKAFESRSVDDLADACVFLASDAAAYITGQTLHVGGGFYMP